MDQTTIIHLLLERLDPKPKQDMEGTEKQEGILYLILDLVSS